MFFYQNTLFVDQNVSYNRMKESLNAEIADLIQQSYEVGSLTHIGHHFPIKLVWQSKFVWGPIPNPAADYCCTITGFIFLIVKEEVDSGKHSFMWDLQWVPQLFKHLEFFHANKSCKIHCCGNKMPQIAQNMILSQGLELN